LQEKALDMLLAIASITEAAIDHATELSEEDTSITAVSLGNLPPPHPGDSERPSFAADNSAGTVRNERPCVSSQDQRPKSLASLKTFIETHFPGDEERRSELAGKAGVQRFLSRRRPPRTKKGHGGPPD
jgi:hypothetical protein